jgi:hypothetical protein
MENIRMQTSHQESAMTEISLALAMAFFSIMVLTMVSMGVGDSKGRQVVAAELSKNSKQSPAEAKTEIGSKDLLVIYHHKRFLNRQLKPLIPGKLVAGQNGRIVLAVDPSLPLSQVLSVRSQIPNSNLIITSLDQRWLAAIGD